VSSIRTYLRTIWIALVVTAMAGIAVAADQPGKEPCSKKTADNGESGIPDILDENQRSVTHHVLKKEGEKLKYKATAASLPVRLGEGCDRCSVFFISYCVDDKDKNRPISFVFNGGPGASSVYLHLGALGPRVVPFEKGGGLPDFPYALTDNAHTWLWFTDLVFVDPVGTGYSRCAEGKKKGAKKSDKDGPRISPEDKAWGVREDLEVLSRFIRLYLTRQERWLAPKFLVGESYGGLRVAALAEHLQSHYGIAANGAVLVSPALEFGLLSGDRYHLLPWVVGIPSFAATARYHGRASGPVPDDADPREALKDVERFAVDTLLPALAEGKTDGVNERLADSIGLSSEDVSRLGSRISVHRFVQYLLEDKGRLVSVYDGTWTAVHPDPAGHFPGQDPLLVRLNAVLTPLMNGYVRRTLQFESDIRYRILNEKIARKWNWRSGLNREQGFVGVAEDLKRTMSMNPQMKVLVVHGVFDLITPYFGSMLVIGQMGLDPSIAPNVTMDVYDGGHMFYTHPAASKKFFERAKAFFENATGAE